MFSMSGLRILITQSFLYSYGGSEVITLELAEHFSGHGAEVLVAVHGYSDEIGVQVERLQNARLFLLGDTALDEILATRPVDIAWIHHQVLPPALLFEPGSTVFVFNHMSASHPLEYPFAPRIERALASAVLFPSEGALDAQLASGLLDGIPVDSLHVFGNPAPDAFSVANRAPSPVLRRLVVVSNHIPEELVEALEALRLTCDVTVIGLEEEKGGSAGRVLPADIHAADAVVTIGKTVQYALVAGVPVYCYDHFGGPGWLDEENFKHARYLHFAGRGFAKKPPNTIVEEIRDGYPAARLIAETWRDVRIAEFSLTRRVSDVLGEAAHVKRRGDEVNKTDVAAHLKAQAALGTFMVMAHEIDGERRRLRQRVADLREQVSLLTLRTNDLSEAHEVARAWIAKLESDVQELRQAVIQAETKQARAESDAAAGRLALQESDERLLLSEHRAGEAENHLLSIRGSRVYRWAGGVKRFVRR